MSSFFVQQGLALSSQASLVYDEAIRNSLGDSVISAEEFFRIDEDRFLALITKAGGEQSQSGKEKYIRTRKGLKMIYSPNDIWLKPLYSLVGLDSAIDVSEFNLFDSIRIRWAFTAKDVRASDDYQHGDSSDVLELSFWKALREEIFAEFNLVTSSERFELAKPLVTLPMYDVDVITSNDESSVLIFTLDEIEELMKLITEKFQSMSEKLGTLGY